MTVLWNRLIITEFSYIRIKSFSNEIVLMLELYYNFSL